MATLEAGLLIIVTGLFLAATITSFVSSIFLDKLLRYQHSKFRASWEADGKLNGTFWTAPASSGAVPWLRATRYLADVWLDTRPQWVFGDLTATNLYNSFVFWYRPAKFAIRGALVMTVLLIIVIISRGK